MESLGEFLKREREFRKVSLEEIARVTRIRLSHLGALERDDHGNLPGRAYGRVFAKAYAQCLGIDFKEVQARLGEEGQQSIRPAVSLPIGRRPVRRSRLVLVCLLVLALIFFLVFYYVSLDRSGSSQLVSGKSGGVELRPASGTVIPGAVGVIH